MIIFRKNSRGIVSNKKRRGMSDFLAPLSILSLKGNRWLDKPSFSNSTGNYSLLVFPFCSFSHGHEFENNRNNDGVRVMERLCIDEQREEEGEEERSMALVRSYRFAYSIKILSIPKHRGNAKSFRKFVKTF